MGWNTTALFVRDRSIDELIESLPGIVDYVPRDAPVSGDEATSSAGGECVYLAETAGWCQLWDPCCHIAGRVSDWIERGDLGALKQTRALEVVFSSVSSMYGFWLYDDRQLTRHVLYIDGEVSDEPGPVGDPLPVESRIDIPTWGPDEDFLFAVVKDVTGVTVDFEQRYRCYDLVGVRAAD